MRNKTEVKKDIKHTFVLALLDLLTFKTNCYSKNAILIYALLFVTTQIVCTICFGTITKVIFQIFAKYLT